MILSQRARRTGGVRAWVAVVLGLGIGLMVGSRLASSRKTEAKQTWHEVDVLRQMYLAPSGYNFIESNKSYEGELIALIHDRLLHYDPVRDRLVPGLARSYDESADGLTWTFHLREARTPEGLELTADDVVFSFNLCLDQRFDCKRRGNFVQNKKPIEAAASDPHTVTFTCSEPFHSFDWAISELFVVPRATFAEAAVDEVHFRQAVGVQQPELKYLSGFGPYQVRSRDTQEVQLVRNDRFWGRGNDDDPHPRLRQINLVMRKEDVTAEMDFRQDDQFVYRMVPPLEAERLKDDPDFLLLDRGRSGGCFFFWLNQNPRAPWGQTNPGRMKLFQSVEFRRALAHAIDRNAIIQHVFKGYAEPIYGPVSPIFGWSASSDELEEVTPRTDPAAAVSELEALGLAYGPPDGDGKRWLTYEEGSERVPLEIEIRTSRDEEDRRRKTAEEVKSQLEAIGIKVKVVEERFGDMVMRLDKTYDYEAAVMVLEGIPDAAVLRHFFVSSGPMHFVNPYQEQPATDWERKVDELYQTYATSPDAGVRQKAILDVQKTWVSVQPAFHLVNDRKLVAVRRDTEINGMALTGRSADPVLQRTVVENIRLRRLESR